jgi:hypothetical protein
MIIQNYNFTEGQILDAVADGNYLWVSFGTNLKKVSAFNPTQVYYDLDLSVTAINKLVVNVGYVYLAIDNSTIIGRRYSTTNPLTTYTDFTKHIDVSEAPIDALIYNSNIYFLTPGNISGQNAIISQYTLTGTLVQLIDLSTVVNASSFVLDSNNEIRVLTNTNPASVVRVFDLLTTPQYSTTLITD